MELRLIKVYSFMSNFQTKTTQAGGIKEKAPNPTHHPQCCASNQLILVTAIAAHNQKLTLTQYWSEDM
jgi:pterin-4a-carbinolamine dehydratase